MSHDIPSRKAKLANSINGLGHRKYARLSQKLTKTLLAAPDQPTPCHKNDNNNGCLLTGRSPKDIFLAIKDPSLSDESLTNICSKKTTITNTTCYDHLATNITVPLISAHLPENKASPPSSPSVLPSNATKYDKIFHLPPSSKTPSFDHKSLIYAPSLRNNNS